MRVLMFLVIVECALALGTRYRIPIRSPNTSIVDKYLQQQRGVCVSLLLLFDPTRGAGKLETYTHIENAPQNPIYQTREEEIYICTRNPGIG